MGVDNKNNDDDNQKQRQLKAATDKMRKEALPILGEAYDENGPAAVLALTVMLADIWLESGFTTNEWRSVIDIFDLREWAESR
jgi:hypothetical protein